MWVRTNVDSDDFIFVDEDKNMVAKIHESGYSAAITAKSAELYAHALTRSGTEVSSMHIGTGKIEEVYDKLTKTLKDRKIPSHLIYDLCKYDKRENILFLDGREVEFADLIKIVEKLQFEALKKKGT